MFSRSVVPEVSGMEASIGKESPSMPLFPVPASPSPVVSFAKAGGQNKVRQFEYCGRLNIVDRFICTHGSRSRRQVASNRRVRPESTPM